MRITTRRARRLAAVIGIISTAVVSVTWLVPVIAAGALLHPSRRPLTTSRPPACDDAALEGDGVTLRAWICRSTIERRAFAVFLHGIADNRAGVAGAFERFTRRGFDVIAYDSRAHGESAGAMCTYGFHEQGDLRRVIMSLPPQPIVLIGSSLGAAVALQTAAAEPRVSAVVAAEVFSDLSTVARERAPFFLPDSVVRRALLAAGQQGGFDVDRISPVSAATSITVPVLLIHGALDIDTRPDHSRRVFASLRGPKRLLLVEGARHNQSLSHGAVWAEIEQWLDISLPRH
jgi:uncharacterized protein